MRREFSLGRMVGQALEANLRCVTLATSVANSVAGAAFTNFSGGGNRAGATTRGNVQQKQLPPPQIGRASCRERVCYAV